MRLNPFVKENVSFVSWVSLFIALWFVIGLGLHNLVYSSYYEHTTGQKWYGIYNDDGFEIEGTGFYRAESCSPIRLIHETEGVIDSDLQTITFEARIECGTQHFRTPDIPITKGKVIVSAKSYGTFVITGESATSRLFQLGSEHYTGIAIFSFVVAGMVLVFIIFIRHVYKQSRVERQEED